MEISPKQSWKLEKIEITTATQKNSDVTWKGTIPHGN